MKKRRVAKLVALSMVAATLLTGVNVQAKEEKVVTAMTFFKILSFCSCDSGIADVTCRAPIPN